MPPHSKCLWGVGAVPYSDNPDDLPLHSVEEPIRRDDHLPVRQFWEFRHSSPGTRKPLKPAQWPLRKLAKPQRGRRSVTMNVGHSRQKLVTSRGREPNLQPASPSSSRSASLKTVARSCPSPAAISRSPLAIMSSSCLSCSDRSYASTLNITAAARPLCVTTNGCFRERNRRKTEAASCLSSVMGTILGILAITVPPIIRLLYSLKVRCATPFRDPTLSRHNARRQRRPLMHAGRAGRTSDRRQVFFPPGILSVAHHAGLECPLYHG